MRKAMKEIQEVREVKEVEAALAPYQKLQALLGNLDMLLAAPEPEDEIWKALVDLDLAFIAAEISRLLEERRSV